MDRLTASGWVGLHLVVGACVVLFVPLGLGVLGRGRGLVRWWPAASLPAVAALLLSRGVLAGLLCVPYLVGCLAVPVVLRRDRLVAFAAACLPVAAVGLLAERAGIDLLGFTTDVLGLTAAHFHVAGFGALLLLSLVDHRTARRLAPAGVALVGVGFLVGRTALGEDVGDLIELLGAGLLSAGLWLAIASRTGRAARTLLALSLVTMGLAVLYATGELVTIPHLSLTWMVLTHGVLNATAVLTALVVSRAGRAPWTAHRWSHRIGTGRERFEAASAALLQWQMHRRAGAWISPDTPPAATGQHMLSSVGIGRLRLPEPCEVIDVVRETDHTVMHYRASPGHTFEGDERFTVVIAADGVVRFDVVVRSRPVLLAARLAGPLVPVAQRLFIARCAAVLRRAPATTPALTPAGGSDPG
ncbi:YndJ family transporter [Krasilnikovia sp. MM14-A1004]|uniref:YndJ family transporter n=1 Tax=Krasilnikovia sp. MM14-A1004 TaxID=3373541 RepID=UPI00399D1AB1